MALLWHMSAHALQPQHVAFSAKSIFFISIVLQPSFLISNQAAYVTVSAYILLGILLKEAP